jgi:hypothetical protein
MVVHPVHAIVDITVSVVVLVVLVVVLTPLKRSSCLPASQR